MSQHKLPKLPKLPKLVINAQIINNDKLSKHTTLCMCSVRTTYIRLMSAIPYIIGNNASYSKPWFLLEIGNKIGNQTCN